MVMGEFTVTGLKIGVWKYYDKDGRHYKSEVFLIPKEEEELLELRAEDK
jgi:hypothetical protein